MKKPINLIQKSLFLKAFFLFFFINYQSVSAQPATKSFPVGIGSQCGEVGEIKDSLKYFNYNSANNVLNTQSLCQPKLVITGTTGFDDIASSITLNATDGYLYYCKFANTAGVVNSYVYRWLPTSCPTSTSPLLPVYKTFPNQLIIGCEFDPNTGLGYQVNLVDTFIVKNPAGTAGVAVDVTNNVGIFASHVVVNGNPAISYYDITNGDLKYVRAANASGTAWNAPITIVAAGNIGQFTSMAIVNGFPAITYLDVTNKRLKYVRATNASGTAWGVPVTVKTANALYLSMTVVNGKPAISFYDAIAGTLNYVQSSDVNGTAWGLGFPVDLSVGVNPSGFGYYTSMTVVNGFPAIAYYNVTNGDLKFVRSMDANGVTWSLPVTVEAINDVGLYASMKMVNGNPAIAYYDNSNGNLRYIRASNVNGTAWGTSINLSTSCDKGGWFASLEMVGGNPAIAYLDISNADVKYIRATDANGIAWSNAITVESINSVGESVALAIVNGNPAVAFYDGTYGDLRFKRANDATGSSWYSSYQAYNMELQQVNFTSGAVGISKRIDFGGRLVNTPNGDIVMTAGENLLGCYDNKYFSLNWKDYSTPNPLVATYIDSLQVGACNYLVGLSYSDGKLIGSITTPGCTNSYRKIDILSGALSPITYIPGSPTPTFFSTDMTNITSGIGAAKRLISAVENPVGSKTYDVEYEVIIKNYGNTPVTNVQAYDTLNKINGSINVLSATISSFTAPPGFAQNTLYNGKTIFNLLTPGGTLSNLPGQNIISLKIACKIANLQTGVVYNNQAFVTGTGLLGDALRDSSTNGSLPDLNQNDKPDDVGESQPTPLLIAITPQTPPCSALTNILYTQSFGSGTGMVTTIPVPVLGSGVTLGTATTGYASSTTQPIPEETYTVTNQVNAANTGKYISLTDHTGNSNGRMLIVNADAASSLIYRASFTSSLCTNQQYSLSFYAAFIGNSTFQTICSAFGGFKYPKIKMRVLDGATGLIISEVSTSDITNLSWQQYGFKFVTPSSFTNIIIELSNNAAGGCGNDMALDDIQFGICDAAPAVTISGTSSGCIGSTAVFNASLSDPAALPGAKDYQWQLSPAPGTGPWTDILGATSATYTITSVSAADIGKYYRVIVSAIGNMLSPTCRYTSIGQMLSGKLPSVAASAATKNKNNICPGISVSLGISGGTLGSNAIWKWYTGSAGGTLIGTGSGINVTPLITTTYYVRAEGDCNTTTDQQVTVFISCDIDKDKDGIPDYVESNIAIAFSDANGNGISNAFDITYAGFKDNNNDFINDDFEADGDSDNDGIPNYLDATFSGRIDANGDGVDDRFDTDKDGVINMLDLDSDNDGIPDVVEANGVDTNGDGLIDNFNDSDGDGLTQSVDANNSGAYNTGAGLGLPDFDNDGIPNFLDLDSDSDGIPDLIESGGTDINNDGRVDGVININGIATAYVGATALLKTGLDINNDGKADSYPNKNLDQDFRPNAYDLDADGDGITDVIEAGFADADLNGVADGTTGLNGWSTSISLMSSLNLRNTEGVGNPDYLDIDADGDGIPDNIEGQSTTGYKLPATLDIDGDGLASPYDNITGFGGSGIFVYDNDGDGIPDYCDFDTDGDGAPDICEGNDWNLNGMCDELLTPTGLDADGDGLDNRFDSLNSITNVKGTSYMMGNGGSVIGDVAPGTKATVQMKNPLQLDRDWRYVGTVLPVQFLNFTGFLQDVKVTLSWTIISTKEISQFVIERSTDNNIFLQVGILLDTVKLNEPQNFKIVDDINSLAGNFIYYRLKVIGVAGEIKYSNVLIVKRSQDKTPVIVMPNPASKNVSIKFFAATESEITLRLIDNIGKIVLQKKQKINKGNNVLQLNNLEKYSSGIYSIQLLLKDEIVTQKLILSK